MKRIIYIGSNVYLSSKLNQLLVKKNDDESSSIPLEDIAAIELDSPQITITSNCLNKLMEFNCSVVVCNEKHLPSGLLTALDGHVLQGKKMKEQVEMTLPLKKRLWKQIVIAKISNQHRLLKKNGIETEKLSDCIKKVQSGDSTNQEGQAAQYYWKKIFGNPNFIRDRDGDHPNNLLNYGYIVLRSLSARAVVSAGLHPSIGLFHHNQYNAYCLADDIMEPYRPFVDETVLDIYNNDVKDLMLNKEQKTKLLQTCYREIICNQEKKLLMSAIQDSANSLVNCISGEAEEMLFPEL